MFIRLTTIFVVSAMLLTSGCGGWYLRGTRTNSVAIETVYLNASSAPKLRAAIARELRHNGVSVAKKGDAQATIELNNEVFDRRVLSVDPNSGKVREVELGLEVGFSVRGPDGKILVAPEKLSWVQDFIFDESSLLGTVEKATTIQRELANDAAQSVILRLETVDFSSR